MKHVNTMECFVSLKKKEILPYAIAQVNLEHLMLRAINRSQKDPYCVIPLTGVS